MRRALAASLLAASALVLAAPAAPGQELVRFPGPAETFATPFHVAAPPGDTSRVFVVEAEGTIRLVKDGVKLPTPFLSIEPEVLDISETGCECGMFSMALAPDYASTGRFYVFFTRDVPVTQHELVIREYRRSTGNEDVADDTTGRDVLVIDHPNASNHNGGQLQFGPDGNLYISVGDGGSTPQEAQSLTTLLGKLLRIDPTGYDPGEYSIPAGNPFGDEIYAYGLRNPYRFSFDRLTGDLIIGDVGNAVREEVDFVPAGTGAGRNFGWRCFEGTHVLTTTAECSPPLTNHSPPALEYDRAGFSAAVNGGFVVRDTTLPSLLGRYVYGDTGNALGNQIFSATLFANGNSGNAATGMSQASLVSFGEDACAHVYVAGGNTVHRIQQSAASPACAPQTPGPPGQPPAQPTSPSPAAGDDGKKKKCGKGKKRKRGKCKRKKRKR